MPTYFRPNPRSPAKGHVTQVARAVATLVISLAMLDLAQAAAADGVSPGTGGQGNGSTGSAGGNGGGQSGAWTNGGGKNGSSSGNGAQGEGGGNPAAGGARGIGISADLTLSASRQGGDGVDGSTPRQLVPNDPFSGTAGGGGGAGAFVNGQRNITIISGVSLSGGNGGDGNAGRRGCTGCSKAGAGGGGNGIVMSSGGTLTNTGTIQGGAGGAGAAGAAGSGSSGGGGGGHGVEGASLTILNSGVIRAGAGGVGGGIGGIAAEAGEDGAAIHWTGGNNTLRLRSGSVIDGALWVGSGATATISADNPVAAMNNWLLLDGSATISTASQPITFSGPITGTGGLTKASAGTLILSGTNTFGGGLNIQAGEVQAQLVSLGTGAIRDNGTLRLNSTADGTLNQALTGSGSLIKEGSKQLTLNANAQLSGTVQVSGGTLAVGGSGTLTAGAIQLGNSGGTLDLSASTHTTTISALSGVAGTAIRTGSAALVVGDASNQTFGGTISGTGSLTKQGSGSLTLTGTNTYTGTTTISAGTVMGTSGSFGTGAIVDNASLVLDQAAAGSLSNVISGIGSLTKHGAGTVILSGANTYAGGTTINAGTLVGSTGNFGSGAIVDNAALVLNQTANGTLGNIVSGAGSLTKQGSGTLTLSGTNTYTGGTTISAGTVVGSSNSFGVGMIVDNASLVLNQVADGVLNASISGSGSLTKQGAGSLILNGTGTYAGGTTINAGTLVGSASSFGSGGILDNALLRIDQSINADWLNVVSGTGRVEKTGSGQLTLRQVLGASGGLDVRDGRIASTDQHQLGAGAVTVSGSGQIALTLSSDTQLRHIGGDGLVAVDLGDTQHSLTRSTAPSGATAFTGILALSNASLTLSGPGAETMSAVTLRLDAGGRLLADQNSGSLGALQMNGGLVRFTPGTADDLSTLHPLQINRTLDLSGTGTVQVDADLHGAKAADSMGSLMTRDDGVSFQLARLAPGAQVLGDASGLGLAGSDGQRVGDSTDGEILQDGERVATTTTRYRLSPGSSQDGLYLTGQLLGIDVLAGHELVLSAPADASGAARDLSAAIGGAGGLAIDAGKGSVISLSSQDNAYGGNTRLVSGTLALAGGALPDGSIVTFTGADAGLDLANAGRPQRLGGFDGNTSNTIQLGGQTLTLDTVGDHAFAGTIAGSGGLVKSGAGTQTLSGANTYAGGTTISGGTLIGSTGSLGSGGIRNDATLVLDQSTDGSLSNPVSGSGSLIKQGSGSVTLSSANSYAGGTTVNGGTLTGSADSFGTGAIRNDATLIVDQAVDGALHNNLSGSGTFVKGGAGTLTLDGTNTGSGRLRIDAGTLRATVDQLGSGAVVNNATLSLDVPRDALLDSRLSGTGQLVKSGAGDLTLEGAQSAGGISVRTGGLIVGAAADGSAMLQGNVDVAAGARLQGNGTIAGNATLAPGATLQLTTGAAPLHVQGDLHLDPGAQVKVSLDPTARMPVMIVDGQAAVDGAVLHIDAKAGDWSKGSRIDLLQAGQTVGQYASVDSNLAFLSPKLEPGAKDLTLVMDRNAVQFQDLAQTPNQGAVAGSIDSQGASTPAADQLVKLPRNEVGAALEALAGGLQAGAANAPALVASQQRTALGRHLRDVQIPRGEFDDGARLWVTAYQSHGTLAGDQVATTRADDDGLLAGIDLLHTPEIRLGIAVGTGRQILSTPGQEQDRADVHSASVAAYGAAAWHGFNLRGALTYGQSNVDTRREVVIGKAVSSLKASERAHHADGFLEVGLPGRLPFGQIEPFLQLGHTVTWTGGFKESGDDTIALSGGATRDARSFGMVGFHGNTEAQFALGSAWRLQGTVALQHLGGPATVNRRVSLPGAQGFSTSAASGAGTGALVDLGLIVLPRPRMTLSVHVDHQETGASRDDGVRVQGDWQF